MVNGKRLKEAAIVLCLAFCFSASLPLCFSASFAHEPIQLDAKEDDISLTDNITIARAQVEKYPENPEAHFNLAIALSRTSYVEEAIKELRKTKQLIRKPENAGTIDKKIKEYEEMIKNDPEANNIRYRLAFSHYLKAYFLAKEEEKKEAKLLNKDKQKGSSLLDSNKLYIKSKSPVIKKSLELSIKYFEELLNNNPNDIWAKIYLAFILVEQYNEIEKAKGLWMEASRQDPNNPAPYFFLGELHIKEGNLKEGISKIGQALLLRAQGY